MEATTVEIQPGPIEGETLTATVGTIIQHPLGQAANRSDSPHTLRKGMSRIGSLQPAIQSISALSDRFSQTAPLLANEGTQVRQQFDAAE